MDGRRRLFHFGSVSLIIIAALLAPRWLFLVCLGAVAVAFVGLEVGRLLVSARLNRWFVRRVRVLIRERETSRPLASTYAVLSALLVVGLFERDIAAMALICLAVGDPAAGIVGGRLGRRRVWGKSIEGSETFFLSCLAVGALLSSTVLSISLLTVFVGSLCAALVESLPLRLDDNLTIPVSAAAAMAAVEWLVK